MSLKSTKEQLIQLLADKDNKVIALSGKWGTGKSYMWEEVKKSSKEDQVTGSLYASLFGLSSIDQIKMKLIQSAVPAVEANPGLWDSAKQAISSGIKVLEGFHEGFKALNDLGLVLAPAVLRQRLIVLDDIERKHADLNIDEVLGFIDEFTQQYESRFILILNSDQLDKREVWNTLREKVIDQELRLNTSSAEAFEIAIALTPSEYAERIRSSVEACGLTNIRIIRKVVRAANRILGDRKGLTEAVLARIIPSTVLLSGIHYKGIEDGPTFDFVLAQGTANDWSLASREEAATADGQSKSKWKLLMRELGVASCDDFELILIEFLESGLFDASSVSAIVDRYVAEDDAMVARNEIHKFFERAVWDYTLTDEALVAQAADLAKHAHLLDGHAITSFYETVDRLPGGHDVAELALDTWISALKARDIGDIGDDPFHRRMHPKIEAEFDKIRARAQANTSVFDACIYIAQRSGWGTRQEMAMKSASVQDIESVIRTRTPQELRQFMAKMTDLCLRKGTYEPHFGSAMDNFVIACRNIANDESSGRLGKLVGSLIADSKLSNDFEPAIPANPAHSGAAQEEAATAE